ncbi:MAG: hypothetical protein R3B99_00145 [Polyangiales bacterium]
MGSDWPGTDTEVFRVDIASGEVARRRFPTHRVAVLHGRVWVASWRSTEFRLEEWRATNDLVPVLTRPSTTPTDLLACGDVVFAALRDTTDRTRTAVYRVGPDAPALLGQIDYGADDVACAGEGIVLQSRIERRLWWFDASGRQETRALPASVDAPFPRLATADEDHAWVTSGTHLVRVPRDGSSERAFTAPDPAWMWLAPNEVYFHTDGVWWQARVLALEEDASLVSVDARPVLGVVRHADAFARNGRWIAAESGRIHIPVEYVPRASIGE